MLFLVGCACLVAARSGYFQRGGAPEFSGEMIGWVLNGFSAGSQKVNIFQKVDKNNFQIKRRKNTKKRKKRKKQALNGCSVGFSVGSQWVLSGYSVSTQGTRGYSDCSFLSTQGVLR